MPEATIVITKNETPKNQYGESRMPVYDKADLLNTYQGSIDAIVKKGRLIIKSCSTHPAD